ncbi:MAG: DUF1572 family protein [Pirellulales bacterium]|nr:DUF1572 family protein [Pirellulales bacterium]
MPTLLDDALHEFRRHRTLAEEALRQLGDEDFFRRPTPHVNSAAIIVKHLAGNLRSRWTDFLATDGEKPDRDRDGEFMICEGDCRERLMAAWEEGWQALFTSASLLKPRDLDKTVSIRGEPHSVEQALLRSLLHAAYHVGQVLYVARMFRPDSPWLTIAPGQSHEHRPGYLSSARDE